MGAYSDATILTAAQSREILERVIYPTVEATGFTGFLYAGMMMTAAGPKVLEFNVRLGDPETQPLMHRMASDFVPALLAAAEGQLGSAKLEWRAGPSVCVVLASGGYPGDVRSGARDFRHRCRGGSRRHGLSCGNAPGRGRHRNRRRARAGRHGRRRRSAQPPSTALTAPRGEIRFEGMHYRRDIGRKGLERYNKKIVGT